MHAQVTVEHAALVGARHGRPQHQQVRDDLVQEEVLVAEREREREWQGQRQRETAPARQVEPEAPRREAPPGPAPPAAQESEVRPSSLATSAPPTGAGEVGRGADVAAGAPRPARMDADPLTPRTNSYPLSPSERCGTRTKSNMSKTASCRTTASASDPASRPQWAYLRFPEARGGGGSKSAGNNDVPGTLPPLVGAETDPGNGSEPVKSQFRIPSLLLSCVHGTTW